jgi:hypothetical protein
MRLTCDHCGARLQARYPAYLWTAAHFPAWLGIAWLWRELRDRGVLRTSWGTSLFVAGTLAFIFLTAWVIPWRWFKRVYRTAA